MIIKSILIAKGIDGKPVYIREAKNGLKCNCTCYECRRKINGKAR